MSNLTEFMLQRRNEVQSQLIERAWDDESFKQELASNPKNVLEQELNIKLPEAVKVQVIEEDAESIYIVIPRKPAQELSEAEITEEEELSNEQLEAVAGGGWVSTLISNTRVARDSYLTTVMWGMDRAATSLGSAGLQKLGISGF